MGTTVSAPPEHPVHRLEYNDENHRYTLDGKRLVSVTTILGQLNKPALVQWAADMGADAAWEVLETARQERRRISRRVMDAVYNAVVSAHREAKDSAAQTGSVVHDAIHQYATSFFDAQPPDEPDARRAWDSFIAWWSASEYRVVETERMVVDPNGRYAGRFDLLLEHVPTGGLVVADVKTSKSVYKEHVWQCAAYAGCLCSEGTPISGTLVVHVPKDGRPTWTLARGLDEWTMDFLAFNNLFSIYESAKQTERAVRAFGKERPA